MFFKNFREKYDRFSLSIGRAGRVSSGTCYRMVTRDFYESFIPEFGIPEMQVREMIRLRCQSYHRRIVTKRL